MGQTVQSEQSKAAVYLFFLCLVFTGTCPWGQAMTFPFSEKRNSERLMVCSFTDPMAGEMISNPMGRVRLPHLHLIALALMPIISGIRVGWVLKGIGRNLTARLHLYLCGTTLFFLDLTVLLQHTPHRPLAVHGTHLWIIRKALDKMEKITTHTLKGLLRLRWLYQGKTPKRFLWKISLHKSLIETCKGLLM